MDSSTALVQAASGLERLMVGAATTGPLKDSTVAQISAAIFYQSQVIAKLTQDKAFQASFRRVVFKQIREDFYNHIDTQARIKPKSFHHVYEWNQAGTSSGRLFKLKIIDSSGISFRFNYEFDLSKTMVPTSKGKHRHVFSRKAFVMEAGMPVKIAPRRSERIVFESDGEVVFMPKGASVTVRRPGGPGVKNQFSLAYSRFFSGQLVNESIKRSGFQSLFNNSMAKALRLPVDIKKVKYSFSPNSIKSQADMSLSRAFAGMVAVWPLIIN